VQILEPKFNKVVPKTTKNEVRGTIASGRTDLQNTLKTQVKLIRPGTTQLRNRFKNIAGNHSKISDRRIENILSAYN
jgi:hypothetical protein